MIRGKQVGACASEKGTCVFERGTCTSERGNCASKWANLPQCSCASPECIIFSVGRIWEIQKILSTRKTMYLAFASLNLCLAKFFVPWIQDPMIQHFPTPWSPSIFWPKWGQLSTAQHWIVFTALSRGQWAKATLRDAPHERLLGYGHLTETTALRFSGESWSKTFQGKTSFWERYWKCTALPQLKRNPQEINISLHYN